MRGSNVAAPTRPSPRSHQCSTHYVSPLLKPRAYMGRFCFAGTYVWNCSEEPSVYEETPGVWITEAGLVDEEDDESGRTTLDPEP